MTSEPFKIDDIKFDNIHYTTNKEKGKTKLIYFKYKKNNSLKKMVVQMPTLLCEDNFISNGSYYSLDIPLITKNENKKNEIIDFLEQFDNKILYDGNINSSLWFTSNEVNFRKTVRYNNDKPFIKLKILNNLEFNTILQLNNGKRISINEVPKKSWIKMLLEFNCIHINNNNFGLYIKPVLISFSPIEIPKYVLLDDSDNEDDIEQINDMLDNTEIFIKSTGNESSNIKQNESTILELPNELSLSEEKHFSSTSSDNMEELKSSK